MHALQNRDLAPVNPGMRQRMLRFANGKAKEREREGEKNRSWYRACVRAWCKNHRGQNWKTQKQIVHYLQGKQQWREDAGERYLQDALSGLPRFLHLSPPCPVLHSIYPFISYA